MVTEMIKANSTVTISGNVIIERPESITKKINEMNSGRIVELNRAELLEISNNTILSKSFDKDDIFLAGVRGFCFFPERPQIKQSNLQSHFEKYNNTAIFNTNLHDFVEFFDFGSGFFDHHHSVASSRFVSLDSVDFIAFHAKRTKSLTLFLDLIFIDEKSCFTALISCIGNNESLATEILSVKFNLEEIIDVQCHVDHSVSSIFKTLTSCLMSLISMDYSIFCSSISDSNMDEVMSTQLDNFSKIIRNDFLSSGMSGMKTIDIISRDMFLFFSSVVGVMLK